MVRRVRLGALLLALAACDPVRAEEADVSHMKPAELLARIEAGDPPALVDVRSGGEYARGHVPGAVHIPFWAAYARADRLTVPRDEPVVVYCEHGPRAGLAKAALRLAGFERILYLEGHMSGWKKAGLPQEREGEAPTP